MRPDLLIVATLLLAGAAPAAWADDRAATPPSPRADAGALAPDSGRGFGSVRALEDALRPADEDDDCSAGHAYVSLGSGATLHPFGVLLACEPGYCITDQLSIGLLTQLGLEDHQLILAPALELRGSVHWSFSGDRRWSRWCRASAIGGVGGAYAEETRTGFASRHETGFLANIGLGFELHLFEKASLLAEGLYNAVPTGLLDDRYFASCLVTLRVYF